MASPTITESEISRDTADLIMNVAKEAASFLKVDLESDPADSIVTKVDDYLHRLQKGIAPKPEDEEIDLFFGCIWGEQLVREFGWQWAAVTFHEHGDSKALGVFSTDRSLAIYPFHFVHGCLENGAPVTIMLAFNMLRSGSKIPKIAPGSYLNVMENVHHIVPRD